MKYKKWIVFGLTAIVVIVSQFFVQQRYTGLLQVGAEYQWPVTLSRSAGWIPSDYLTVTFLGTRTAWTGARPPVVNQEIYVTVEPKPNGILRIVNASPDKPTSGDYILARMPHRVDHRKMPVMRIVDMRQEMEKEGRLNVLSRDLMEGIQSRLDRAEQTILFLNRRGFSTSLVCPTCGTVAKCEHCSVSMTYHKQANRLLCHICGAEQPVPERCPNSECGDPAFKYSGIGTQRVEEVLRKVYPKAKIERMDSDTMTKKDAYRKTLGAFRGGQIDILLGTQMIAKGLDFPGVTLVGVVQADLSLHLPDFRAGERTFQLLTQVAGRAGRGDLVGEVIVQTFTPFHPAIQAARTLDYDGFIDQELEERKELGYPPFGHLVCVTLRGKQEELVKLTGETLVRRLQEQLDKTVRIGGPVPAPLAKARGEFRYQIMLRAALTRQITGPLKEIARDFKWPEGVAWAVDVDALSLL